MIKQIFSVEGPYYRIMTLIANLFILNIAFVACGISIILMGPGLIALYQVTQRLLDGSDDHILQVFAQAVRRNFRRGLQLMGAVILVSAVALVAILGVGAISPLIGPILIFAISLVLLVGTAFIFIFANTADTLRRSFDKALYLTLRKIVYVIAMLLIPVLVAWAAGRISFFIEASFGFSLACAAQQYFVKRMGIKYAY